MAVPQEERLAVVTRLVDQLAIPVVGLLSAVAQETAESVADGRRSVPVEHGSPTCGR